MGLRLLIAACMIYITHFIAQMFLFYDLNTIKLRHKYSTKTILFFIYVSTIGN